MSGADQRPRTRVTREADSGAVGRRSPADPSGAQTAPAVVRLPIDESSAKARTGGPIDEPEDYGLPVWAGTVPLRVVAGAPEADEGLDGVELPGYVDSYRRERQ